MQGNLDLQQAKHLRARDCTYIIHELGPRRAATAVSSVSLGIMAGAAGLTTEEVVERLNRSLEQELSRLESVLPSPNKSRVRARKAAWKAQGSNGAMSPPKRRATRGLLSKLEASRLHALEALSSVLFEGEGADVNGRLNPDRGGTTRFEHGAIEGCNPAGRKKKGAPLEKRLRSKAAVLVEEERQRLLSELHQELDEERKAFVALKPAISEEAHRSVREEQASDLKRLEHELRMLLARRELKHLKDIAYERFSVVHAQEKERTLMRLRRSLGRGKGFSVNGLRDVLWDGAREQRTRALEEGEAAFKHSCHLFREQWEQATERKISAMHVEASTAQESALAALRERERLATESEMMQLGSDLEQEATAAERNLKRELEREAARGVNAAVELSTAGHKQAQKEATIRASETLRYNLQSAAEQERNLTKAALYRETRRLHERKTSLLTAVEEAMLQCSLKRLSEKPGAQPLFSSRSSSTIRDDIADDGQRTRRGKTLNIFGDDINRSHTRRVSDMVKTLEDVALAAEVEHSTRVQELVRERAVTALRHRHRGDECKVTVTREMQQHSIDVKPSTGGESRVSPQRWVGRSGM